MWAAAAQPQSTWAALCEVAKTADHAPARTFYLWRVNLRQVTERVLEDLYHAAYNLRERLAFELSKEQEVLSILEQIQQASISGSASSVATLTSSQRKQLENIRKVAAVLETSLLRLEDTIMMLKDF
ncbi:hypothetical protein CBR_g26425 [Chara braunii]|uniref:DNA-directed RNA polymerase III subunit RPC3 n=1 Tax=Chara braunii TaxID=69332 RepID=A0A388L7X5_CHABU|nr:hypothetical protein CBR_g26425 [Chara braunii]|eukprot:GBG78397.1 hypothetical protein CBR_g26425 [Chara braunii]